MSGYRGGHTKSASPVAIIDTEVRRDVIAVPDDGQHEQTGAGTQLDGVSRESAELDHASRPADGRPSVPQPMRRILTGLVVAAMICASLGGLAAWLGQRAYQDYRADQKRALFVQAAKQGAVNLTTIDFTDVDAGVRRILDSSTGRFYDEFMERSVPFVDFVKHAQSKTQGTITAAGLESENGSEARVLVALSVTTSAAGVPDQKPRGWRMRITVQEVPDERVKVSNVEFVP